MCVEKLGKAKKGPVMAWKMFCLRLTPKEPSRLMPLTRAGSYKTNRMYESKDGPGYQAFVTREDAYASRSFGMHPEWIDVRAVTLYDARKGIIEDMDEKSNGKPGWCAQRMKILPKSNV